ncbi:testis-expressed protein 48 isoform X1 [Odocoileus virginianus]|uniref:Testis-expressed protein 48 isoform X1 n=1 Tax=Odocoileus virginianus TaxID=9874 RepID=A0A6J0VYA9_ODOVR|nr:uncharacterized protein TEX48 isoform X3 [Odocoileus virginianus texanus]
MAAHQNLASKIFSLCCKCCEKPNAADDSKIPNQTQELQLSKHGVQKDELNRQSLKHSDAAPCMSLGKATLPSEKTTSCFSSSEYDVNSQVSKRGFHKRRLSRYFQDHWPYQPCLIGRP